MSRIIKRTLSSYICIPKKARKISTRSRRNCKRLVRCIRKIGRRCLGMSLPYLLTYLLVGFFDFGKKRKRKRKTIADFFSFFLSRFVMQDHLDARKFTIVERYVNESSQKYVSAFPSPNPPIHPSTPSPLPPNSQLINQPPQFTDIISKTPTGKPSTPTSNPSSPKKWIFDATMSWISVRRSKLCRMRLCGTRWRSIRTRRIAEGCMYLGYM